MRAPPQSESIESTWDTVAGIRMHGLVCTSGDPHGRLPPIVLVHGLGVSTLYLLPTMRKLAARYRVYAPDLPGFGRSAKPRRTMDMESLADALLGWLKARGVGPAVFVCNSMGCQVAVALAVRHPDLVTRLILSGPTMDPHAGSPFIQVLRLLRDALHEKPSLWFVAGFDYVRAWPLRVLKSLRLAIADHVERRLPAVAAPTLVVRGSLDPVAPRQWVREMVDLLPSAEFAEIEGTGHAVNYSTPDQFTALIQSFPRSR